MKAALTNLLVRVFKPTLYYIEKNSFLGDFVTPIVKYTVGDSEITFEDPSTGEKITLSFEKLYYFHFQAKKETAKSVIPVDEGNIKLVNELESVGIKLTKYEKQQIIEDGEASEVYQSYLPAK